MGPVGGFLLNMDDGEGTRPSWFFLSLFSFGSRCCFVLEGGEDGAFVFEGIVMS
jgi:hypothetical protein